MSNPKKKPLIGIIGGIGSGKSTVAAEFAKLGCAVIAADGVAHDVLEEGPVRDAIVGLFGPEVLAVSGQIDRRKLAEIVFADAEKLAALNAVVHPGVLGRTDHLISQFTEDDRIKAIVLDMPLLIEVGWADRCDKIVFVECDRRRRIDRATRAGTLNKRDIEIRENFQISLDSKASLADNTLNNNSDFSALVRQIKDIFSDIIKSS